MSERHLDIVEAEFSMEPNCPTCGGKVTSQEVMDEHAPLCARIKELEASEAALRKRVWDFELERDAWKGAFEMKYQGEALAWRSRAESLQKRVDELEDKLNHCEHCGVARFGEHHPQCEKKVLERSAATYEQLYKMVQKRAESAEKERDGYKRGLKDEARRFGEQVDRNEALEKRLAEADQDRQDQVRRLVEEKADVEKRLAALTAPTGEKELDEALAWADEVVIYPTDTNQGHYKPLILADAVRSLRGKLDAFERQEVAYHDTINNLEQKIAEITEQRDAWRGKSRIRGGR